LFFVLDSNDPDLTPYPIPQLRFFPKKVNIPEFNPLTKEGARLGKHLFYDGRLSGREVQDSLKSCASCHVQSQGFNSDVKVLAGKGYPCGLTKQGESIYGENLHVTLPLTNLIYNSNGYFRNGFIRNQNTYETDSVETDFKNLESIVWISIVSEEGVDSDISKMLEIIGSDKIYTSLFISAFGDDKITMERIVYAISQFIRTITAADFKFYHFMEGRVELNDSEQRGYELFYSEKTGCFHCHAGSMMMTTNQYYNNGGGRGSKDYCDRASVTLNPREKGAFRAPSLINCALNTPYMHDGRFSTLEEVIDFYSEGIYKSELVDPLIKGQKDGGIHLNKTEKKDLVNFLYTLTDYTLISDSSYACPDALGRFGIRP
jgi:cytochrome c peroxidase